MNATLRALTGAGLVVAAFGIAVAKLPPPPPMTEEQKAAAEAKKAKDAAAADVAKQQQTRAEDRVAARYFADMKAQGKAVPPPQVPAGTPISPDAKKAPPPQPEKAAAHSPAQK